MTNNDQTSSPVRVERRRGTHARAAASVRGGVAAIGAVIYDADGLLLRKIAQRTHATTSNAAQLESVVATLEFVHSEGIDSIEIQTACEHCCRVISGAYKARDPLIRELVERARSLIAAMPGAEVRHVDARKVVPALQLAQSLLGDPGSSS